MPFSLPIFPGLPLAFDLEGPEQSSDTVLILGARPISNGFDLNFAGSISSAILAHSQAPIMFSRCVLECLETIAVDTSGTSVSAQPFNISSRQLVLIGPASPDEMEQVLRTLVYSNRALNLNTDSIQLEVLQYIWE